MSRLGLFPLLLLAVLTGCPGGSTSPPPADPGPPVVTAVTPTGTIGASGALVTLTATATNDPTTWTWTFDGGGTLEGDSGANVTVRLGAVGSYTGSVVACNGAGCSEGFAFGFGVTLAPPTVQWVSPVSPILVIEGSTHYLRAGIAGDYDRVEWTLGGGATSTDPTTAEVTVQYGPVGVYAGEVIACNAAGCSLPVSFQYVVGAPSPPLIGGNVLSETLVTDAEPSFVAGAYGDRLFVAYTVPEGLAEPAGIKIVFSQEFPVVPTWQVLMVDAGEHETPRLTTATAGGSLLLGVAEGIGTSFRFQLLRATALPPALPSGWVSVAVPPEVVSPGTPSLGAQGEVVLLTQTTAGVVPRALRVAVSHGPWTGGDPGWTSYLLQDPTAHLLGESAVRPFHGGWVQVLERDTLDPSLPLDNKLAHAIKLEPANVQDWTLTLMPRTSTYAGLFVVGESLYVRDQDSVRLYRASNTQPSGLGDWEWEYRIPAAVLLGSAQGRLIGRVSVSDPGSTIYDWTRTHTLVWATGPDPEVPTPWLGADYTHTAGRYVGPGVTIGTDIGSAEVVEVGTRGWVVQALNSTGQPTNRAELVVASPNW